MFAHRADDKFRVFPDTARAPAMSPCSNPVPKNVFTASSRWSKKPTPVYKKWWFWAIVGVSAYVEITGGLRVHYLDEGPADAAPVPG
jgi:hypothetical protein